MNKDMTVREAFEKAFGPIPEGATCHVAYSHPYAGSSISATHVVDGYATYYCMGERWSDFTSGDAEGPDISDRPAYAFLGFFGEKYDKVVNE